MMNAMIQSNLEEESVYLYGHSLSLKKVKSGEKARTEAEIMEGHLTGLIPNCCLAGFLIKAGPLPKDSTTHSGADPLIAISNEDSALQTGTQTSLIKQVNRGSLW